MMILYISQEQNSKMPLLLLGLGLLFSPGLRVEISGPGIPYQSLSYEIHLNRGTAMVNLQREYQSHFGRQDEVALLTQTEFFKLMELFGELCAATLPDAPHRKAWTRYRLEYRWKEKKHSFFVEDPEHQQDPRYRLLIHRLRSEVLARISPMPFRDQMLLRKESGLLLLFSEPQAEVWIDGRRLEGSTPLKNLKLRAGMHQLRLKPLSGGLNYDYEIKISAGRTTSLRLDLR